MANAPVVNAHVIDAELENPPQVVVKRSPIHGKGLFAGQRFLPGDYIGRYEGPVVKKDGPYVLWILEEDGTGYGIDGKNHMRWVNHSSKPNAEFREDEMYAIRVIEPGDEITFHYGDDWDDIE
ncbi:MAG: SET domain-containing protein [Phycisphaeraceae bacterium]